MTSVSRWLMNWLGDDHMRGGGHPSPPGTAQKLDFGPADDDGQPIYVARTYNNDGFELWIGYRSEWLFHCRAEDARKLAWFILWEWWAKGTWFGLKRTIWYWALRKSLEVRLGKRLTRPRVSPTPARPAGRILSRGRTARCQQTS